MLSILIPTYNSNISDLVITIHQQCIKCNILFEIIVCEDGSSKFLNQNENTIKSLPFAKLQISQKNCGRIRTRQKLSDASKFDWLLFLDSDVLPKSESFINTYLDYINSSYDAIFGGFSYQKQTSAKENNLRWRYGKKFEEVDAKKRNKNPYRIIISANLLIRKSVFNSINSNINYNGYGLDNYFAALLKKNKSEILHINNEVYHLGLETNDIFLEKTKQSIKVLLDLFRKQKMNQHSNKLLSIFTLFKYLKINYLANLCAIIFRNSIEKNLLGTHPNLYLLQFYKILFICHEDLNQKNND